MIAEPTIQKRDYHIFIDGQWQESESGLRYVRESPAHDVVVGEYPESTAADVDRAVAAARRAFDNGPWPRIKGAERAAILNRAAALIRDHQEELALIDTLESGKPITQARDEISGAAGIWDYAATLAFHTYGDTYNTLGDDMLGLLFREPIGVVGIITPWNFPFLILSQKLPFALAVGCTAVVKPSELTPGSALRLAALLQEAGIPDGVVNLLSGYGDPVGARLAQHHDVDMLSFTGSTLVGKRIVAASQGNLKKVSLELGGKNPQIIFDDADLDAALDAVVFGTYFNMGECCNSGSRILIQDSIIHDFAPMIVERAKSVRVGDPLDETVQVGAIINQNQFDKIMRLVNAGKAEGAQLMVGGERLYMDRGRFIQPTVFNAVRPNMAIAQEEVFGPVMSILAFDTPQEAIHIANNTLYGLSAGIWSSSVDTAFQVGRAVRAGTIWINTFMDGYPEMSFGGYKESGLGRELGRQAIAEFTEMKGMMVHLGHRTNWWLPRS